MEIGMIIIFLCYLFFKVNISLGPLLTQDPPGSIDGWFPIYDTMHGMFFSFPKNNSLKYQQNIYIIVLTVDFLFYSEVGLHSKRQLWNSLQWPIYIINLNDKTKLSFYSRRLPNMWCILFTALRPFAP